MYPLSRDGKLFCFNTKTGKILWEKDLISDYNAGTITYSFSCSPYIYKHLLILNANRSGICRKF
ncbi:hypothetical protein [Desulfobacula sp.]|uniref:hypothetical protein n=1 Tax=Desulfobacula sp. TaxID=2593537 RepID=UPI003444B05B